MPFLNKAFAALVGAGLLSAACSPLPADRPLDVGSMAEPLALPEGNLSQTAVAGRLPSDTGSMAFPDPVPAGTVGRAVVSRQAFDGGSMAYPAPLPEGSGPVTRVR